jgi:hypothetical protein
MNSFSTLCWFSNPTLRPSHYSFIFALMLKEKWMSDRPEGGGSTHLWHVCRHPTKNTAVHPRRFWTSYVKLVPSVSLEYSITPAIYNLDQGSPKYCPRAGSGPPYIFLSGPRTWLTNVLKNQIKKLSLEITRSRRNSFRSFFPYICETLCSWFQFCVCCHLRLWKR